jgi:hypothetical protein
MPGTGTIDNDAALLRPLCPFIAALLDPIAANIALSSRIHQRLPFFASPSLRGSVNVRFAPKATEVLRCRELT